LEAELHLLQLRRQDDPQLATRAVEALARLMIHKNLLEDAAYWYRVLGTEFTKVVVRDGKTGADFLNDLATDKRLLANFDEPRPPWGNARLKGKEVYGSFGTQQTHVFEPDGEVLPFFQRHRLVVQNQTQVRLLDRSTNEVRYSEDLPRNTNTGYFYNNGYP